MAKFTKAFKQICLLLFIANKSEQKRVTGERALVVVAMIVMFSACFKILYL